MYINIHYVMSYSYLDIFGVAYSIADTHNKIIKLQYYKLIVNIYFTVIGQVCAGENDFLCHSSCSCFHHFSCIQMSAAPLNSFEERRSRIVHQSPFERLSCLVRLFDSKLFASALNVSLFGTAI